MADPTEGMVNDNPAELAARLEKMETVLTQNNRIDSTTLEKIAEARRLFEQGSCERRRMPIPRSGTR